MASSHFMEIYVKHETFLESELSMFYVFVLVAMYIEVCRI